MTAIENAVPTAFKASASPVSNALKSSVRGRVLNGAAAIATVTTAMSGVFLGQAIGSAVESPAVIQAGDDGQTFIKDVADAVGIAGASSTVALGLGSLLGIAVAANRETRRIYEASRADPGSIGI